MTSRTERLLFVGVFCLAASLLTIHLSNDWSHLHEDNGAMQTTLALSHIKAGLHVTRGHDFFINPRTRTASLYGHHPSGTSLVLAAVFSVTGSASPAMARAVVILFHLGSLLCMAHILKLLYPGRTALVGTLVFAIVPMSAYFGRMVNYEAPCLFGILLQLVGFVNYSLTARRRSLAWLCAGIILAALVDWPAFFFAAAIGLAGAWSAYRGDVRGKWVFWVAAITSASMLVFVLGHLWWAARGSLEALTTHAQTSTPGATPLTGLGVFLTGQFHHFRRYLSHTALGAGLFVVILALAARTRLSRSLLGGDQGSLRGRVLWITGTAASAYVLAAPSWASEHPYWKFFFLPFVAVSVALLFEALNGFNRTVRNTVGILLMAEIVWTSATMIHLRHTRKGAYAVEATARMRSQFLTPEDVLPPPSRARPDAGP